MIETFISYINEISQGNQMIAGAIALAMSGTIGFCLTRLPRIIFDFIKKQFVTQLTLNNTDWQKKETFLKITKFLHKLTTEHGSRTLILDSGWIDDKHVMSLSMGYGNHFFFYKGRFMWLNRTKLDSSGSENMKEEVTLFVLGRSHTIFKELVEDNTPVEDDNMISISDYKDGWNLITKMEKCKLV